MKKILPLLFILLYCTFAEKSFAQEVKEYGIVLLLPKQYQSQAQKMTNEIAHQSKGAATFTNQYHISLFQGRFAINKVPELVADLKKQNFKKLRVTLGDKVEPRNNLYINWMPKPNDDLNELHKKIVKIANPYRLGVLARFMERYGELDAKGRNQVVEYGMSGVMEDYQPHVTLFYFQNKNFRSTEIASKIKLPDDGHQINCCDATKIAIAELGFNGNIEKILQEIDLK